MILRKPYAFLIKHFKLLHLILLGLVVFIVLETKEIYTFFDNYVSNDYSTNLTGDFSSMFVPGMLIAAIIILLLILVVTTYLLIHKNKKQKIYTISIVFYIAILGLLIYFITIFNTLEQGVIDAESARIYRDLAFMIYYPQYILTPFFLIRGLGFNVKQFNFKTDMKELELSTYDNEEIEVNIEFNTYKTKRNLRRYIREFRYYLKENYVMIIIVSVIAAIFIGFSIYDNVITYGDTNYNEKQDFTYSSSVMNINQSFITNIDLGGNTLPNDYYFLVVQITMENPVNYNIDINTDDFKLTYKDQSITPSISYSEYFLDYGAGLNSGTLRVDSKNTYVLPYIIPKEDINNDFKIKLYNYTVKTEDNSYSLSTVINLNTYSLSRKLLVDTVKLEENLSLSTSNLGESYFKINSFEIDNPYYYDYSICNNNDCKTYKDVISANSNSTSNQKTLVVLDYELLLDSGSIYGASKPSINSFVNNFINVEYSYNGNTVREEVSAIVKDNLPNKVAITVNKDVEKAETVKIIITIRNKEYIYIIKN